MHPKRLLFINGHLNAGGCERSLVDLLRHLDYSEYQVDLLLLEGLGDYFSELPKEVSVRLFSLNQAFGPFRQCVRNAIINKDWFSLCFRLIYLLSSQFGRDKLQLSRHLFRGLASQYDAVIAYRPGICTDLAAYAFDADIKISWWHHGEFNYTENQTQELDNTYRRIDRIVAVSDSSATLVREHFIHARDKIIVIPNMICPEELEEKACKKTDVGLAKYDGLILVSVGRMSPEKNMILCPEIGKVLKEKGVAFKWYLVGDGEEYERINKRIHSLSLEDDFILTGRLSNPYPYIKMADMLIHPSRVESQGITILEAMALSTPVIAVKSAGPCEFIKDGDNGFLVEADAESASEKVINLVKERKKREDIKKKGKQTVAVYSSAVVVEAFSRLITSVNEEQ